MPIDQQQTHPPTIQVALNKEITEENKSDTFVVPIATTWNDFGYRIRAEVGIPTSEGYREWVSVFFAFKDQDDLASFVKNTLNSERSSLRIEDFKLPYASLLIESKNYSLIRQAVGVDKGLSLLMALNDIAVLHSRGDDVPGWPDFFTSGVFTHAMTRSSEGHFAFRHGALVLRGQNTSGVDSRQKILVSLTSTPKVNFDFKFDNTNSLRGRIAVIVGNNGCGKTSSLSRLAIGLATDNRRGIRFSQRPEINQVLVFAHSSALNLFKRKQNSHGAASLRVFPLDPSTTTRVVPLAKHTRLLIDIARANDGDFRPLTIFQGFIRDELKGLTVYVPIRKNETSGLQTDYWDENGNPYVKLSSWPRAGESKRLAAIGSVDHNRELLVLDDNRRPRALSLGQSAFLNFSLNALANAGPASVLLIDEPENFLHPNLISRFMRLIHTVTEGTKSIAILATHSPFVVREVQSAQVHVLYKSSEEDSLEVVHPRLQTLGANVASVSNEVFGDDLPEHLYELILWASEIRTMPFNQVLEKFAGELSTEALMQLRRKAENQEGQT